tara:strand:+ start:2665 stop:3252 length:588 start_codon:yes stop_codon:yes gene_type:complete
MRKAAVNIYKFEELDHEAQEKAIEWYRSGFEFDDFYQSYHTETFTSWCHAIGLEISKWGWSGFYSQGDGAHFVGRYYYQKGWGRKLAEVCGCPEFIDIAMRLQSIQKRHFYSVYAEVKHMGHYQHEYCTSIDAWAQNRQELNIDDEEGVKECFRDIMRLFYESLRQEYEYETGDERISEILQDDFYEFTSDGKVW